MKLNSYLKQLSKNNLICIKDLNVKLDTITFLEENREENLLDIDLGNYVL